MRGTVYHALLPAHCANLLYRLRRDLIAETTAACEIDKRFAAVEAKVVQIAGLEYKVDPTHESSGCTGGHRCSWHRGSDASQRVTQAVGQAAAGRWVLTRWVLTQQ
eukprot:2021454-Prymnesium_polylepis.1